MVQKVVQKVLFYIRFFRNSISKKKRTKTKKTYITSNGEEKVNTDEGWIKRSWFEKVELGKVKVCCTKEDSLQIKDIDNLAMVPYSKLEFNMAAKKIVKSNTEISVFEVSDPDPFDQAEKLKIGDLNEVNLDGNWE